MLVHILTRIEKNHYERPEMKENVLNLETPSMYYMHIEHIVPAKGNTNGFLVHGMLSKAGFDVVHKVDTHKRGNPFWSGSPAGFLFHPSLSPSQLCTMYLFSLPLTLSLSCTPYISRVPVSLCAVVEY